MSAFTAAVGALFADPNIGHDAVSIADGGAPVLVRAVARRADVVSDFGDARLWSETTRIEVRFADWTLVTQAINGDACETEFAYVLPSGESFTFTVHAVYLPRPRIESSGPQGVQATFDWQAARDGVVGRMPSSSTTFTPSSGSASSSASKRITAAKVFASMATVASDSPCLPSATETPAPSTATV